MLWMQDNVSVVLTNREGLCGIDAMLGVSTAEEDEDFRNTHDVRGASTARQGAFLLAGPTRSNERRRVFRAAGEGQPASIDDSPRRPACDCRGSGTRITTSYLIDDSMLKRKDEETHKYISASFCVVEVVYVRESDVFSENRLATEHTSTGDGFFLTASITYLFAAWNAIRSHGTTHYEVHGSICTRLLGWLNGIPRRRVNEPVVLLNSEDLYVIVVAVVVCTAESISVLKRAAAASWSKSSDLDQEAAAPPAPIQGDCNVVVNQLQPQDNVPVMLMNREGLYVIITVLTVSNLGCACVLMYSFANYKRLKWRAQNTRLCSAAPSTAARTCTPTMKDAPFTRQLRGARGTTMTTSAIL
ncbi:hypothetical protein HPB51_028721 [Rhipicephalus microplus]|uniref:Uncharacterized protein n=1 Tax=Rhipicephalus microplus TaxID=6941 RepID=A0A9J6CW88_RHIMP|nr:hypothetical protein HPB51_028721 [Rhipicephalus microplus]